MRMVIILNALTASVLTICVGCQTTSETAGLAGDAQARSERRTTEPSQRTPITAEDNPTTRGGRGEPSLDAFDRPAAWIYIDGQEGRFIERDGHPQVQWIINGPVSATPKFRVEAYEPLLGTPTNFNCVVDTVQSVDGSKVIYAVAADEGTFVVGQEYSLLQPGDDFKLRNRVSGDVVTEIAPLVPGTYMIVAGIKNGETGKEGLAVTYFTVGEDQ